MKRYAIERHDNGDGTFEVKIIDNKTNQVVFYSKKLPKKFADLYYNLINAEDLIPLCPRLIVWTHRPQNISESIATKEYIREAFNKVIDSIKKFEEGEVITQPEITRLLYWAGFTKGDRVREYLDYLVCLGVLKKVKFSCNRGGHKFVKGSFTPCQHLKVEKYVNEHPIRKCTLKKPTIIIEKTETYEIE